MNEPEVDKDELFYTIFDSVLRNIDDHLLKMDRLIERTKRDLGLLETSKQNGILTRAKVVALKKKDIPALVQFFSTSPIREKDTPTHPIIPDETEGDGKGKTEPVFLQDTSIGKPNGETGKYVKTVTELESELRGIFPNSEEETIPETDPDKDNEEGKEEDGDEGETPANMDTIFDDDELAKLDFGDDDEPADITDEGKKKDDSEETTKEDGDDDLAELNGPEILAKLSEIDKEARKKDPGKKDQK